MTSKTPRSKLLVSLFALGLLVVLAPAAAAFTVTIDGYSMVWVPYGQCAYPSWTASGTSPIDTYDWTVNTSQVSTSSSYGTTFCSPQRSCSTNEYFTLGLYATSSGHGDYDSLYVNVIYEAGNANGGCGFVMCC
ncbi:MAG TPA: hypothetical protein VHQ65_11890 [Thermoanaerobaculia bacterium]|nr:hypothetical protein [Thermoanaerobaculia bacterium]